MFKSYLAKRQETLRLRWNPVKPSPKRLLGTTPSSTSGGLYKAEQGMSQQGILNYFSVKSIDESLKQASSLGATVVMPKQETGRGHFAILTDPNGNTFALFQGRM